MALAIWVISVVAAMATLADQLRRPPSEWTAADRDRPYWVSATVIAGLFACGLLAALAYAIGVLPRFAQAPPSDAAFSKAASAPHDSHALPSLADRTRVQEAPAGTPGRGKLVIELDDV